MGEIRCHNGYCGGEPAIGPSDCPLCHGRGWHYCGGVESDARKMEGTPYDSSSWAEHRRPIAKSGEEKK